MAELIHDCVDKLDIQECWQFHKPADGYNRQRLNWFEDQTCIGIVQDEDDEYVAYLVDEKANDTYPVILHDQDYFVHHKNKDDWRVIPADEYRNSYLDLG